MTWVHGTAVPSTASVCAPCGVAVTGFTGQRSTSNLPKYPANADLNASIFARAAWSWANVGSSIAIICEPTGVSSPSRPTARFLTYGANSP